MARRMAFYNQKLKLKFGKVQREKITKGGNGTDQQKKLQREKQESVSEKGEKSEFRV